MTGYGSDTGYRKSCRAIPTRRDLEHQEISPCRRQRHQKNGTDALHVIERIEFQAVNDRVPSKNSIRFAAGIRIDARDTLADANRFRSILVSHPLRCWLAEPKTAARH